MKILFIGDTKFDSKELSISKSVIEQCQKADLVIANLEGPVINYPLNSEVKGKKRFSTETAYIYLNELKVDICNVANNHIMDFGEEVFLDTVHNLEEKGYECLGIKKSQSQSLYHYLIKEVAGERVAFLSFSHHEGQMASKNDLGPLPLPFFEELKKIISNLKQIADKVIFIYHGGEEYYTVPWPRRRAYFKLLAKNTEIDVIIGHHSHTVQPMEIVAGKPIFYSLGNFYFDTDVQRRYPNTEKGLIVLYDTQKNQVNLTETNTNRKEKYIEDLQTTAHNLSEDLLLDNEAYFKDWCKQCRMFMNRNTGFLKKRVFLGIGIHLRKMYFLYKAIKDVDIRNFDILLSSGNRYSKRVYKNLISKTNKISKFKY